MSYSKIEWTDSTWNPLTGCTKVSTGCQNCYAERMSYRLKSMGNPNYKNGFNLSLHEQSLTIPLTWKKPKRIFVNSMSDLFHEEVPIEFILQVFEIIHKAGWHTFQLLTKRSNRLSELSSQIKWPINLWMGVSVEAADYVYRIDDLRNTGAKKKFLSLEPLLGPLPKLNLVNIDWVIVGGESGPRSRQLAEEWVIDIRDQCKEAQIPFFFKQWGGMNKKKKGRLLAGELWNETP